MHLRLEEHPDLTVGELYQIMKELSEKYPDREIFFDGDEQAICSRPKKVKGYISRPNDSLKK